MCLYIASGDVERIAMEDRVVYKVIQKNNKSLHQDFQYKPNTLFRLRKKLKIFRVGDYNEINEGFHSYVNFVTAAKRCSYILTFNTKLVEFIIPKGAKYYLGDMNDIVSTSIKSGSLRSIKLKGK